MSKQFVWLFVSLILSLDSFSQCTTTFAYGTTGTICKDPGTILPTINPTSGHGLTSFTLTPPVSGAINATTGEINPSLLPTGSYLVEGTYSCGGNSYQASTTFNVQVRPDPYFNYPQFTTSYVCVPISLAIQSDPNNTHGTWSISPATVPSFSGTSGDFQGIDLLPNTTYTVTHSYGSNCPSTYSHTFSTLPKHQIDYPLPLCEGHPIVIGPQTPIPSGFNAYFSVSGALPGQILTFSNSITGEIDLQNSDPGPYMIELAVTGNCAYTVDTLVEIVARPDLSFFYQDSVLCTYDAPSYPTPTGVTLGYYDSPTANLISDSTTGRISPQNITPGMHKIFHRAYVSSPCGGVDSFFVRIVAGADPGFVYPSGPICLNDSSAVPIPSTVLDTHDVWTGFPNSAALDSTTGEIDLQQVSSNYMVIEHKVLGECPDSATTVVSFALPNLGGFEFPDSVACKEGLFPPIFTTAVGGGTFSSSPPLGNALDTVTGTIRLDSVSILYSPYIVRYTPPGTCYIADSAQITVVPKANANFGYPNPDFSGQPHFCLTADTIIPKLDSNFTTGGNFSLISGPGSIDPTSGTLTFDQSQVNATDTFRVKYVSPSIGGGCRDSTVVTGYVHLPQNNLPLAYATTLVCNSDTNLSPTTQVPPNSIFQTNPPSNLQFLSGGTINISGSSYGNHHIYYLLNGACHDTSTVFDLTLAGLDSVPFIGYPDACQADSFLFPIPDPNVKNPFPGLFSSLDTNLTILDSTTGAIALFQTIPGSTHTVEYITQGFCPDTTDFRFILFPSPELNLISNASDNTFCEGDTIVISDSLAAGVAKYEYQFGTSVVTFLPNSLAVYSLYDESPGTGKVVVTKSQSLGNCSAKDSISFKVLATPTLGAMDQSIILTHGELTQFWVHTDRDSSQIWWEVYRPHAPELTYYRISGILNASQNILIGDSLASPYVLSPDSIGFTMVASVGTCTSDTQTVWIVRIPGTDPFYIPGLVTPNGDGANDTWRFAVKDGLNPDDYRIVLLNRSGGTVWQQDHLRSDWSPNTVPDGVYWWVLEEKSTHQTVKKGGLTIRRQ